MEFFFRLLLRPYHSNRRAISHTDLSISILSNVTSNYSVSINLQTGLTPMDSSSLPLKLYAYTSVNCANPTQNPPSYSAPEATLAAGQVPCHLQNCYYHASDFPPSMPVVPLWPHRVCFGRLECTPTSFLQYSSRRRQTKQDAVRKAYLLSGRPRHMEQSPRHHPYHRLPPSLPACAKDTSVPLSIWLLVLY